jgi:UDP-N-acetylmuramoyl-L-alanyl-D-glutamate--2,6-diaminopimelate ligase
MKLRQLLEGIDIINISSDFAGEVSTLCYSADKCEQGSLFVAIAGLKHDGHDFITEAIGSGARYIIHEKDFPFPSGITAIRVSDSRRTLGMLAKNYFGNPSAKLVLIAVTGTNGKTTITYLMESILTMAGFNCGVIGTVNYRYKGKVFPAPNTTPESYEFQKMLKEMTDSGVTHVVAEVSSHALDLKRVDDCDFALGIFTNLTRDHLDYHGTMENYYQAKKRLFAVLLPQSKKNYNRKMVINTDDEWGRRIVKEVSVPALTYGIEEDSNLKVVNYDLSISGITASTNTDGKDIYLASSLIGKFNLYNIMAAVGASLILKIPQEQIIKGVENLRNVPGRLERNDTTDEFYIFVDYAHTDDALRRVLQNLVQLKKKRIITVFGCGGNRDRGKRPLMGEAATAYSDLTIVTSDNPRLEDPLAIIAEIETGIDIKKIKKVAPDEFGVKPDMQCYSVIPDRKTAIETAINQAQKGDIVLIAGKGHEDYQIIGSQKMSFDDRVVAAKAVAARREKSIR